MEPSSISESFHTARSSITATPPDSISYSSSARSSSVASTVKPHIQQEQPAEMSGNVPTARSDESVVQQPAAPEIQNRVQFSEGTDCGDESISHFTTDTPQVNVAPVVQEQDVILCSIVEGKHLIGGPRLQKSSRSRKTAQRFEWKELEAVLTNKELLIYTMSWILPEERKILLKIKLSSVTQIKLASALEYVIELTTRTSAGGGIRLSFRLRTTKKSRHWYMLLYSLIPHNSKPAYPTITRVTVPDLEIECNVHLEDAPTLTYGSLKQMVMNSMAQNDTTKEIYENWHHNQDLNLCWRYHGRLDWCVDEDESVIGPRLIEGIHTLELRKTDNTTTNLNIGDEQISEPLPIEGVLTRLTNRRGHIIKNQKFSQRRFYFSTHQQYMVNLPLNKKCSRKLQISSSLGAIDLCEVELVRVWKSDSQYGSIAAQSATSMISSSSSAPIMNPTEQIRRQHEPRLCWCCYSPTPKLLKSLQKLDKQRRCFEIILKNGLSIIYEAQSVEDRDLWIKKLHELSLYWHAVKLKVIRDQMRVHKAAIVRYDKKNTSKTTDRLMDSEERSVSQYEGEHSIDTVYPSMWNYGIPARCRHIMCAGPLFYRNHVRKPFKQDIFVLTRDGQLVIFNSIERSKLSGRILQGVYHDRKTTLNLYGSYVYTDYDSDTPERRPARMYPDGLLVPKDKEDSECLFSLWMPLSRTFYSHKKRQMIVAQKHTLQGKSWLFMARTKEDKDLWVTAINAVSDYQD